MKSSLFLNTLFAVGLTMLLAGCSKPAPSGAKVEEPSRIRPVYGEEIDMTRLPAVIRVWIPDAGLSATPVSLEEAASAEVALHPVAGKPYFAVEGAFLDATFDSLLASVATPSRQERVATIGAELEKIHARLREIGGIALSQYEEAGYFTFLLPYQPDMMAPLKGLKLQGLTLNPVAIDRDSLRQVKALTPAAEGLQPRTGSLRGDSALFSGIEKMRAVEFVRLAEGDIGGDARVNGDSVRLGVTDTGITFNHRTFLSSDRKRNRIVYMRDFTREGRIYFNLAPSTFFQAAAPAELATDELLVSGQVIVTPKLPSLPAGDELTMVENVKFKVSPELKAALLAAGPTARLGVLLEESMSSEAEAVDLNGNGKLNDRIFFFLIPGKTPVEDRLYADLTGTRDFRGSRPLASWNSSRDTVAAFAEKIGFDLSDDKLPRADGKGEVPVRSASIVGFDPGNHGSHVAGIAAGSRTIFNDDEKTLARGVAPDAAILMNRVCANNTGCNATQAMVDLAVNGRAQVINMSLGGLSPFNDGYGVQETTLNRLTQVQNVLMVVSAGNSGPGSQTVGSPSVARLSLSVGAAASVGMIQRQYQWPATNPLRTPQDDSDFVFFFSSRGPTAAGGFKPNVVAPGTQLSSIQLNTAPGGRGGLDVYWGTSMAAPAATGAYALLLDAIQKYNAAHPEKALPASAPVLRRVLIESARAFDVNRFDPSTGERRLGQYTWADQGTGMVDLVAAWKKLRQYADERIPTAVTLDGQPVELDYQVLTSLTGPHGLPYDGTLTGRGEPVFGTGLYLDYAGTEKLHNVHIVRQLPEHLAAGPDAGELTAQLLTTMDEFVLKTTYYGSESAWVRAGALESVDCSSEDVANAVILGRGAEIIAGENGKARINPHVASMIHVCIDREKIARELAPGDHGALIAAYRTAGGKVSAVPSFWIPVFLRVPHRQLTDSTGYEVQGRIKSFGVARNYVRIPQGTSLVRITLEVPPHQAGKPCSGVELMALQGNNLSGVFPSRPEARIANCDKQGAPVREEAKRKLSFTAADPRPGTWDVHVFGQYRYPESEYTLRADYIVADSSSRKIEGDLAALNGAIDWTLVESSVSVAPDSARSRFVLDALQSSARAQVAKGQSVIVPGSSGELRSYPAEAKSVTITTGESPGNDIDLAILECQEGASSLDECKPVATSGGSSDEERASFVPKAGSAYAVRVDGFEVRGSGEFTSSESIAFAEESGSVLVQGGPNTFSVAYAFGSEQQAASKLLSSAAFREGKARITGRLELFSADGTPLYRIPVTIAKP
ncbi:MAG: S8 family serine peptidase [Oligoflexia bacterium]|nr:S8 family serine peptidase [Oligoflexia bacterium]